MKTKTVIYSLGKEELLDVIYDVTGQLAVVKSKRNNIELDLSLDELSDLGEAIAIIKRDYLSPKPALLPAPTHTHEPASAPEPARSSPPTPRPDQQANILNNLENRDLIIKDMYVVCHNGMYYSASNNAGQIEPPSAPITKARLFTTAEEAKLVADTFPNSTIRLFSDVGIYRIVVAYPDNSVRFWRGPGLDPATHVSQSMHIVGRKQALGVINAIQPIPGTRMFLLPDLA